MPVNELDYLFDADVADVPQGQPVQAPGPKPKSVNELDYLFDTGPAEVKAQAGVVGSPQQAAEVAKASRRQGIPYALGKADPEAALARDKADQAKAVIRKNPFAADYVENNPAAAEVSADDWHVLDRVTSAWKALTDPDPLGRLATVLGAPAVGEGAKAGFKGEAMGIARASGRTAEAESIEKELAAAPQYQEGFARYANMAGSFVGQFGYDALVGGAKGAVIGAGTGALAGGGAGAVVGAPVGFLGGLSATAGTAAYGRTLQSLDKVEAETGQKLDPAAKHLAAGAVGLLNAGANLIGVKAVGGAAGELLSEAATQAVFKEGVAPALTRFAAASAKGGATGAGLMGGLAAADAVLQDAAKQYSGDFKTVFDDPERRSQVVGEVAQAMADGFVLMGAMHALPAGKNFANDLRLTREATAAKGRLDELMAVGDESQTKARDPEAFADFVARHGDDTLTLNPDAVAKLPPEVAEGMALTSAPDGSAEVPLAQYVARVPDEVHKAIADDVAHGPDAVSVNDATALAELHKPKEADGIAGSAKDRAIPEAATPLDPAGELQVATMNQMYLQPLFPDAKSVGMLEPEFARYSKLLAKRAEAIRAANERRATRDAKERLSPEYALRMEEVREEVTQNVDNRPDVAADRLARTGLDVDGTRLGDYRLDSALVDAVSRPGSAKLLRGAVVKDGLHPDELAALTGHGSGAELVQDLLALKHDRDRTGLSPKAWREATIKAETQERVLDRFGQLDENVAKEAREAAIMPAATEILDAEREALAAKAGGKPAATVDELRQVVAEQFATLKPKQAYDLASYQRAVGRAGRRAELALLAGKFDEAFLAKQQQIQAHLFAEQAKAYVKAQDSLERTIKKYGDKPVVEGVSQRYTDQVQGILQALGLPLRRDIRDLTEVLRSSGTLGDFIAGRNGDLGGLLPDAPLPSKGLADYTVQDMIQLQDLMQALDFQGRKEKKLKVGEKVLELDEAAATAAEQIKAHRDRYDPGAKGLKAFLGTVARRVDAPMLKMEQLFEWFDHSDPQGIFHEAVVGPLHKAQGLRDDMFVKLGTQLKKLGGDKKWSKSLKEDIANDTLIDPFFETPRPMAFTRKNLLAVMLNMGNPTNFDVLAKGYGWEKQAVNDFVTKHATAKDWQWVQGIWNTFKTLEPQIKETYRELAGVGPEMIEANKVFTPFGTTEGGYFPLMKDVLRAGPDTKAIGDALFERGQIQPMPANGYTKARTGASYPLSLETDLIAAQLRATAHDLAFRGPVIEANKFLNHPEVQRAVKQTFGPEYAGEFTPYLRDIANDGVSDVAGISALTRMSAGARQAVVNMMIGFNLGTVYIHGGSAALNSLGELANTYGWKQSAKVLPGFVGTVVRRTAGGLAEGAYNSTVAKWTKDPISFNKGWQEAMAESAEMRNRLHNFDRDLNIQQDRALGKNDLRLYWNNLATSLVSYSDLLTAVPTYMAARDLALANGHTRAEAIEMGQKIVRQAHGSSGIVDRARIQRGSEFQKWFTMFFGYFSHNYNRNRDTWRMATEGKEMAFGGRYAEAGNVALKVTSAALFYALLPAINHARIRHEKEDDEHYGRWLGKALFTQATGDIPVVRDIGRAIVTGQKADAIPLSSAYTNLANTVHNALVLAHVSHDKMKPSPMREAITTAGLVTGITSRQIGKSAQFLLDVKANKEHPEGFYEWYRGLESGHAKPRKH